MGFWHWLKTLYKNIEIRDFLSFLSVLGSIMLIPWVIAFALAVSFWFWVAVPFSILLALYAWYRDNQ